LSSRAICAALSFALLFLAGGPAKTFAETRTVTDAHGRTVEVGKADKIVSIGGAVTEILFALGVGERVVGIDLTSTFPPEARELPQVGYMRALSPEGVLSLAPDLVIAVEGSGPPDAIEVLERASVPFVLVPEAYDAESAIRKIRFIADLLGVTEKGEEVVAALQADLGALDGIRASIAERRKAIFVLGMSTGAPLVAGGHTAANGIFGLAGVDNALSGFTGYKPASDEAAMGAAPDAVVIMAERGHELTPEVVFAAPAFAGTPAARDGRLVALSGSYMLNFGPRTAHAARDLIAAVYPELAVPELPARPWTAAASASAH
jgi:iron complex transport system substrate-binding protein